MSDIEHRGSATSKNDTICTWYADRSLLQKCIYLHWYIEHRSCAGVNTFVRQVVRHEKRKNLFTCCERILTRPIRTKVSDEKNARVRSLRSTISVLSACPIHAVIVEGVSCRCQVGVLQYFRRSFERFGYNNNGVLFCSVPHIVYGVAKKARHACGHFRRLCRVSAVGRQ